MPPLPKIALIASDYPRLEQLARLAAQQGDLDGIFLMGEINRAEIVPDSPEYLRSLVTIGSWVTYSSNWVFLGGPSSWSGPRSARRISPAFQF